jgi:hypothetical protein
MTLLEHQAICLALEKEHGSLLRKCRRIKAASGDRSTEYAAALLAVIRKAQEWDRATAAWVREAERMEAAGA